MVPCISGIEPHNININIRRGITDRILIDRQVLPIPEGSIDGHFLRCPFCVEPLDPLVQVHGSIADPDVPAVIDHHPDGPFRGPFQGQLYNEFGILPGFDDDIRIKGDVESLELP